MLTRQWGLLSTCFSEENINTMLFKSALQFSKALRINDHSSSQQTQEEVFTKPISLDLEIKEQRGHEPKVIESL